jgi:hypothetical protein
VAATFHLVLVIAGSRNAPRWNGWQGALAGDWAPDPAETMRIHAAFPGRRKAQVIFATAPRRSTAELDCPTRKLQYMERRSEFFTPQRESSEQRKG